MCCVVLCSGIELGEIYLSRGLLRTSQFFLYQDTTLHSNFTVAQESRGNQKLNFYNTYYNADFVFV